MPISHLLKAHTTCFCCSAVQLEGDTSEAKVTGAELSGEPTHTVEGGNNLEENLQIDPKL